LIVMKFGGSSVGEAPRILSVAAIVRERIERRPVVVVSALEQVTNLLEQATRAALRDDRESLDPILAELVRRHRWALSGCIERADDRHRLGLEIDDMFDDLRQRLRSIRILGEGTPRAADGLLAFGELLSARLVAAAFRDKGLPAAGLDARQIMVTDDNFGCARPAVEAIRERAEVTLVPLIRDGSVPILGGFIGSTQEGETTTLGRGGSDTSAAVLGAALGADEIQIWTDVDGLMSADPRLVPAARTLPRVSFAEAAELAFYGARVLHPASIAPAVARDIPVRVLNSLRPAAPGTVVLGAQASDDGPDLVAVASRDGVTCLRLTSRSMRADPQFLPAVLRVVGDLGIVADGVVATEVAVTLVVPSSSDLQRVQTQLHALARVDLIEDRAIICVVGSGLAVGSSCRGEVLSALAEWQPEIVALGGSPTSVTAVVAHDRLEAIVGALHRRFFEESRTERSRKGNSH
jgi:aspartate kinase